MSFSGGVDLVTGAFSATGPVTGATEKLAGATGNISFSGVQDLTTGAFSEDINGVICVDLAP